MSSNAPERVPLNHAVKQHELESHDWEYHAIAKKAQFWFTRLNVKFFLAELPTPYLTFKLGRPESLGFFHLAKNEVGAEDEISLNVLHLNRSEVEIASTLCHEAIHLWQKHKGRAAKPNGSNYHNRQFRDRAELLGIPCSMRGETLDIREPFLGWAIAEGVSFEGSGFIPKPHIERPHGKGSKLKKWSCRCCNVRVAVSWFAATCNNCGQPFQLQEN